MTNLKVVRILAIGDVVGPAGCLCLEACLSKIKQQYKIDIVIANGENSSHHNGISYNSAKRMLNAGVDVITTGNHAFKNHQATSVFEQYSCVLRPANFHHSLQGAGVFTLDLGSCQVCVINLIGNVYMPNTNANPFDTIDTILRHNQTKITLLDFHAEASAEKKALAFHVDGRVSAVFGTHTHIQTADEQILPLGTAYITDLGMTGPAISVLGISPEIAIKKQITGLPVKFELASGQCEICGAIIDIATETGKAINIERFKLV